AFTLVGLPDTSVKESLEEGKEKTKGLFSPANLFSPETHNAKRLIMLDIGCGSGILAMAFAQATRGKAVAVDLDPDSVKIAKGNVENNGLAAFVKTGLSNGYRSALVKNNAPYDLIMANIFADPLRKMAKDLKQHLRPGGMAILSGILNNQANAVLSAHRQQGLNLVKRQRLGEWTVLALERPSKA
ncbi:MAG: methyltransferase domain-containing protein, partial [Alphaproteobacteria bacterium]|nr:methyltransferase domain-containing protein [Alphaproteobacteria bacterium]